jgi:hypothetical protein
VNITITSQIKATLSQDGVLTLSPSDDLAAFAILTWHRLYKNGRAKLNIETKELEENRKAQESLIENCRVIANTRKTLETIK